MEGQLTGTATFSGTFVVCYSSIYFYLLLKRVKFQKLFHPQPLSCVCIVEEKSRYLDMLKWTFILFLFRGKLEKISNQCKSNTMAMHKENTCVSKV